MALIKNLLPTRNKPITICGQSYPSTCVVYKRVHWYKKAIKKVSVFVSASQCSCRQLSPAAADLCRGLEPWIIICTYLAHRVPDLGIIALRGKLPINWGNQ